jgi:hypothetical protein
MRPGWQSKRAAVRVAVTAFFLTSGLHGASHAHDAGDSPTRAPEESRPGVAGGGAPAAPPSSLRGPLVLVGAGAITAGLGAWWLHEDARQKAGSCTNEPTGRAACASPSVGPGLGVAMLLVGAQATLGGLVWMAVRWRGRPTSVAFELGPSTLALRGTF